MATSSRRRIRLRILPTSTSTLTPAGPLPPGGILAATESTQYALLLIGAEEGTHRPQVMLAPFSGETLPGVPAPTNKYAFGGDVLAAGVLPTIVTLANANFHQVANVTVLAVDGVTAALAALAPGTIVLDPPPDGAIAPVVEQVLTRRTMPVPPRYSELTMQAWAEGRLTFPWLWTNTVVPFLGDAALVAAFQPWVDFVRASLLMRAGIAGGAPRNPATELAIVAPVMLPPLQNRALAVARLFLPGLREPAGVGAQLALMQNNQLQIQQQILAGQAPRPATLADKYPQIWAQVRRLAEVPTEADLPVFWSEFSTTKTGGWLGCLENCHQRIAQAQVPPMIAPYVTPAFVTDMGTGRFVGRTNDINEGVSIFRVIPGNGPNRREAADRNRVYNAMGVGAGQVQAPAVQLMLANDEVSLPASSEVFRGQLEGYYVLALAVMGEHNRAVAAYHQHVMLDRVNLITLIEQYYPQEGDRHWVFATVLTYIYRLFNDYNMQLLAGGEPVTLGVPAAGAPVVPPFEDIRQYLGRGRLKLLTEPPPGLFAPVPPPLNPGGLRAAGMEQGGLDGGAIPRGGRGGAAAGGGGAGGADQRRAVERPNQNPGLKRAWEESGHTRVFGEGAPYYDASQQNNKARIESDTPGLRVCVPMAVRGICYSNCTGKHDELSRAEVQRVAQRGGLHVE